jgi:hypothetical protein
LKIAYSDGSRHSRISTSKYPFDIRRTDSKYFYVSRPYSRPNSFSSINFFMTV